MTESTTVEKTKISRKSTLKNALLAIQILLPFGAYLALQAGNKLLAWIIAALFVLSMVVLVWVG